MPLEIALPFDDKIIGLEEYIDIIESCKYDFKSQDDIIDSARFFNQLNNNKKLLTEKITGELVDLESFQKSNLYGPRVFILLSHPKFYLRAVVWEPVSALERSIKGYNYDICHDHNFDILTAGYFGPGYETRTYTYNYDKITGYLGEKVELKGPDTYFLREGQILLYRAKKDIHIQLAPESLSISLNLIPKTESIRLPQYQFSESSRTITRYLQNSGNELMVRMAGALADNKMIDALYSLLEKSKDTHINALAASSLVQIRPERKAEIHDLIIQKGNSLLADVFEREMTMAGSSLGIFES